jgi:hypothetical protein
LSFRGRTNAASEYIPLGGVVVFRSPGHQCEGGSLADIFCAVQSDQTAALVRIAASLQGVDISVRSTLRSRLLGALLRGCLWDGIEPHLPKFFRALD